MSGTQDTILSAENSDEIKEFSQQKILSGTEHTKQEENSIISKSNLSSAQRMDLLLRNANSNSMKKEIE